MAFGKNMRLREWLIAQVDSGRYAGLCWQNEEKSMFRIPWKHASKQDYKKHEDAALFKAWAVYKGKYKEGRDRADPSAWKTRLRCALNKSVDFREVPESSQLDISEPYKVYKILPESGRITESPGNPVITVSTQAGTALHPEDVKELISPCELYPSRVEHFRTAKCITVPVRPHAEAERLQERVQKCQCLISSGNTNAAVDNGQVKQDSDVWPAEAAAAPKNRDSLMPAAYPEDQHITDFRLHVRLFYQGQLVKDFTTSMGAEGCRILYGSVPSESERIYGPSTVEHLHFPQPVSAGSSVAAAKVMARLLPHLQRGVLLWMAPEGLFAKRFCQGRVYWDGPLAEHRDKPNKLEREKTCKLLDARILLAEVNLFLKDGSPKPDYLVELCFGEEFPEAGKTHAQKLITASVEPVFVKKILSSRNPKVITAQQSYARPVQKVPL